MNVLEWLRELAECQDQPELIDFDGAEEALAELRQRSEEIFQEFSPEGEPDPDTATLLEMASLLGSVADCLEEFLDSGLFYKLKEGMEQANELLALRDGLRKNLEAADPEVHDDSLA